MARAKTSLLSNKKQRLALAVQKKPIYESLGDGVCIGYRRNQSAGTWVARKADGKGGSWQKVIGTADDLADADGNNILSWAQAQAKAFEAVKSLGKPDIVVTRAVETVATALDQYERDLETRGGDKGNVQRLRRHIDSDLLESAVTEITADDMKKWRDGLAKKLAAATVNRTANAFKAALNLAADHDDRILTRNAWEKGLKALPDAEEARNAILNDDQVRKIVDAAYDVGPAFGRLVEVAAVTGARYSQIAGLMVEDLQDSNGNPRLMMPGARKGKGVKKIFRRPVPIPPTLAKKLREAAGGRDEGAPLLLKPQRAQNNKEKKAGIPAPLPDPWRKSDHYRPFNKAVEIAFKKNDSEGKITKSNKPNFAENADITIYSLRHSSIVRQILAGVPVRVVAVLHDTSVQMIEKNYSKFLADHSDTIARAALLEIS